jgi:hypothetical protein
MAAAHRATSYYAASHGKPAPAKPSLLVELEERAAKRKPRARPGSDGKPLERHVLKAVVAALRLHPRVAKVERNQSGLFQDGDRLIRVGSKGKLDLTVYLKDGRYIEIEVKRGPDVKLLSPAQIARIKEIRSNGGLAGWCWSVESAIELIP